MLALLLASWTASGLTLVTEEAANPIRKVVTLLQDMQKEIEAEGKKEEALYDKFMCYCDGNTDGMSKAAEGASQKITELKSQLEAQKAEKSQLDQELMQHKLDREAAKNDFATAEAIRNKEHAQYEADAGDSKANLEALTGAISALENGMGSFLQLPKERMSRLTTVVQSSNQVDDEERSDLLSLLQGKNPFGDYGAQSGEIVGMLKAMKDEMDKDLGGIVSGEEQAQAAFQELAAAKKEAIAASSSAIESKTKRSGDLAVAVVTTADDIEDTTADLSETQGFLANLASSCANKKKEWQERSKMRADEVAAISEAIGVLNDDDALDLFKKTLSLAQKPSSMGFLQKKSSVSAGLKARNLIQLASQGSMHHMQLDLIAAALKSKKADFSKVLGMIDNMSTLLGKEQADDDAQKSMCDKDFAESADSKKATEEAIASSEASIAEMSEESATLASEIATLQDEIKALDQAVADATEDRKEEHADFITYQSQSNAATQLIEKAKNRLNKFYRPNMYKEAPKRELTDEEKILASSGRSDMIATDAPQMIAGTTQTVYVQRGGSDAVPAPPPETWGAYEKKEGKSNGVLALMDMLVKELKDELTEATHDEETGQKDYERLMSDSQAGRAKKADSITSKESSKADLDVRTENTKEKKTSQEAELMNTNQYIAQLHSTCDFLVQNYDLRKAARENEIESLKNAKAVLSGADFA
jgi:septal ring factor EnvC (AmiA/AmiB activator)